MIDEKFKEQTVRDLIALDFFGFYRKYVDCLPMEITSEELLQKANDMGVVCRSLEKRLQVKVDLALDNRSRFNSATGVRTPGNSALKWVEIEVPPGHRLTEGIVGPIDVHGRNMTGGGLQVYLNFEVPAGWVKNRGGF